MNKTASMFSMPNCEWCDKATTLLTRAGYDITYLNTSNPLVKDFLRHGGFTTVPQIFIDGKLIGGYDDLAAIFGEVE